MTMTRNLAGVDQAETENRVVLIAENGERVVLELLDLIEYLGKEYVVFLPTDEESDEVIILELASSSDEREVYVDVEDENILNAVFGMFKSTYKNEFNFQDEATVKEVSNDNVKYRSRLGLWFIAWVSAFAGGHYNWLGFKEAGAEHRAQHGVLGALLSPACWIFHCWEQIAILFGKYREDAYGNPVRYFSHLRNLLKK